MKPPYEVECKCGYKFRVSHSVLWRLLDCPECGRSTHYERNLKGDIRTTKQIGRFRSKKEMERRLYALAKESSPDLYHESDFKTDKISPRVQVEKDSSADKADGSKDIHRPVRSSDKGLSDATGTARGVGKETGKGRVARK